MLVRELISKLMELTEQQKNLPVLVRGYEGGANDVEILEPVEIAVDYHLGEDYYGRHRIVDEEQKEWIIEEQEDENIQFTNAIQLVGNKGII